jgi:hypothetical protein
MDALGAFFGSAFIIPAFVYCYAGVTRPVKKTLIAAIGALGVGASAIGGSYPRNMGSPVEGHLDADPTNPNTARYHKH